MVTFIYTRCPLPQFCPLMDRRFAEIQSLAAADAALRGKVRLLSISFDPGQRSRRGACARMPRRPAPTPRCGASPPPKKPIVDRLAATFGVNVIREKDGTITHNLRTAVIDPRGRIVSIHDSNAWSAASIVDELKRVLAR